MSGLYLTTLLVADYDEAKTWFVDRLGFRVKEDSDRGAGKRWIVLATGGADLLLAKANSEEQRGHIGKQAGGRVAFFLETDDFDRDLRRMSDAGVRFLEAPRNEDYGKVAQFADLYGNKWDLIERA